MFDLDDCVREMSPVIRKASRAALAWYRQDHTVDNKSGDDFDPVTEADRHVERVLRDEIEQRYPDHSITGEEFGTKPGGEYGWLIDPIDGTRAFVVGQPMWGTLVGLCRGDEPVAGWMHIPTLDETFIGDHKGARWLSGDQARTLATRAVSLDEAILASTHPSMFDDGGEREAFGAVEAAVRMTRWGGDCLNYGLLAMGHIDVIIEAKLEAYDIVPLIPIIERAGGVVTDRAGHPPLDGGFVVAAGSAELHAAVLDLVNRPAT